MPLKRAYTIMVTGAARFFRGWGEESGLNGNGEGSGLNGTGPRGPKAPRLRRGRFAARGPVPLACCFAARGSVPLARVDLRT